MFILVRIFFPYGTIGIVPPFGGWSTGKFRRKKTRRISIRSPYLTVICHFDEHVEHENIFITLQHSTKFLNASFYCRTAEHTIWEILLSHVSLYSRREQRAQRRKKSKRNLFRFLRMSFVGDLDNINFPPPLSILHTDRVKIQFPNSLFFLYRASITFLRPIDEISNMWRSANNHRSNKGRRRDDKTIINSETIFN